MAGGERATAVPAFLSDTESTRADLMIKRCARFCEVFRTERCSCRRVLMKCCC